MTPDPQFTVVLPTRDRESFLADALASVLDQRDVDLEVVVVDDGSTDRTPELLSAQADARLRVVRQPRPCGVAVARNRGIELARGAWVAFLDDDDLWAPTWLATARSVADRETADVVYGSQLVVNVRREPVSVSLVERPDRLPGRLREINVLGGPSSVVARTSLLRRAGGFDPSFSVLADWELWLRLADLGRIAACADILVAYTKHPVNMHVVDARAALAEYRTMTAKHAGDAATFDELRVMRWMADGNRRFGRRRVAARLYLEAAVRHRSPPDLVRFGASLFGSWNGSLLTSSPYLRPTWLEPYGR